MKWVTHMVDEDRWVRVCRFCGGVGWRSWMVEVVVGFGGDVWFYSRVEGGLEGRKRGNRVKRSITSKHDIRGNKCISL